MVAGSGAAQAEVAKERTTTVAADLDRPMFNNH
jgi:hypothetical protein